MAQTYTLEEAADKLNLSVDEFKRRLNSSWTKVHKFRDGKAMGVRDDMALVGILSTQLMVDRFVNNFPTGNAWTP